MSNEYTCNICKSHFNTIQDAEACESMDKTVIDEYNKKLSGRFTLDSEKSTAQECKLHFMPVANKSLYLEICTFVEFDVSEHKAKPYIRFDSIQVTPDTIQGYEIISDNDAKKIIENSVSAYKDFLNYSKNQITSEGVRKLYSDTWRLWRW